jgi:hypothetical protein
MLTFISTKMVENERQHDKHQIAIFFDKQLQMAKGHHDELFP